MEVWRHSSFVNCSTGFMETILSSVITECRYILQMVADLQLASIFSTHRSRLTHIWVTRLTIIDSDNGLSPNRWQSIIWTCVGILLISHLGTNLSETIIEIHASWFETMHAKMASAKRRPSRTGFNVLMPVSRNVKFLAFEIHFRRCFDCNSVCLWVRTSKQTTNPQNRYVSSLHNTNYVIKNLTYYDSLTILAELNIFWAAFNCTEASTWLCNWHSARHCYECRLSNGHNPTEVSLVWRNWN